MPPASSSSHSRLPSRHRSVEPAISRTQLTLQICESPHLERVNQFKKLLKTSANTKFAFSKWSIFKISQWRRNRKKRGIFELAVCYEMCWSEICQCLIKCAGLWSAAKAIATRFLKVILPEGNVVLYLEGLCLKCILGLRCHTYRNEKEKPLQLDDTFLGIAIRETWLLGLVSPTPRGCMPLHKQTL